MPGGDPVRSLLDLVDGSVLPGADRYTLDEVAARAGVDPELTRRLWRALGFPDPEPGDRIGGDLDVAALRLATDATTTAAGSDTVVRQTRIMSAAVSRIAELWVDQIRLALDSGDTALVEEATRFTGDQERATWLLGYIHRRLVAAALRRELQARSQGDAGRACCVAFADLVGYTTLTERLGPLALSELVGRFEALAYDTVARHGGRVVKTIGDEVLVAAEDPVAAVAAAEALVAASPGAGLPPLRVGMDHGPVVWFEGDVFGGTVNRAARLVAEAGAGGIAATAAVRDAVPGRPWTRVGTRALKGVGDVEVVELAAPV